MDPNEALRRLRDAITQFRETTLEVNRLDAAHYMAEYADALDGWLSHGGFLPDAWSAKRV